MSPETAPSRHLRVVRGPESDPTLIGPQIAAHAFLGADQDEAQAAESSLLALVARLRPDLPVDQAWIEVASTLAEFDARCAAVEGAEGGELGAVTPAVRRPRWASLAAYLALAGPPLLGGGGVYALLGAGWAS